MIKKLNILSEEDKILREVSEEVTFPLNETDANLIDDMLEHLVNSQIEEIAEKYDLRPGMGLAAIQLGVKKRYFVLAHEQENKTFNKYVIINPKIISYSNERICAGEGEGCLSINRPVDGVVPRYARVTIEYQDKNGNIKRLRAKEELSIAVQHEIDHLNGVLFIDYIDENDPYKDEEKMRLI